LFDAFTNAIGGEAAVDKLKTRRSTGTIDAGNGQTLQFDALQQAPDKQFTKVEAGPNRTQLQGFDGTVAWSKQGPRVTEAQGTELATAKLLADFYSNLDLKKVFPNAQTRGKDKVGDKEAWVVRTSLGREQPQELLYFDPDSKLLLRRVLLVPTPLGPLNTQSDYSDWREVSGVKVPFVVTQTRPNAILTQHYTTVEFNVPVDEKAFAKPAAEAAPTATGQGDSGSRK
jgi:hypothetical protein